MRHRSYPRKLVRIIYTSIVFFYLCLVPTWSQADKELSLSVNEAINIALYNAYKISNREGQLALQRRIGSLRTIRSYLPKISLAYNQSDSVSYAASDNFRKNISLELSLDLFQAGNRLRRSSLARLEHINERHNLELAKLELISKVWKSFYTLDLAEHRLYLEKHSLELAEKQWLLSQQQYDFGYLTELKIIETELELNKLRQTYNDTWNTYKKSILDFRELLQLGDTTSFSLEGSLDLYKSLKVLELSSLRPLLLEKMRNSSIDLENLEFKIMQVRKELDGLKLRFLPSISLNTTLNFSGINFPLNDFNYSFALSFSLANTSSPSNLELGLARSGFKSRSRSLAANSSLLEHLDLPATVKQQKLKLELLLRDREKLWSSFKHVLDDLLRTYYLAYDKLDLAKANYYLQQRQLELISISFNQGNLAQQDLLKKQHSLSTSLLELNQQILAIKVLERQLESRFGLQAGQLEYFTRLNSSRTEALSAGQ